jgi:hypothetical protein
MRSKSGSKTAAGFDAQGGGGRRAGPSKMTRYENVSAFGRVRPRTEIRMVKCSLLPAGDCQTSCGNGHQLFEPRNALVILTYYSGMDVATYQPVPRDD